MSGSGRVLIAHVPYAGTSSIQGPQDIHQVLVKNDIVLLIVLTLIGDHRPWT